MTSKEGLAEIFGKSLLAEDMKAGEIEDFLALSRVHLASYDKGEVVFHDGDMPRCLYMLVEGEVHIQKDSFTGRRIFLSEIDEPGDVFGEVYLLLRKKYDMYVETVRDTKLLVIDSEAFSLQETAGSRAVLLVQQNLMRVLARKAYFMHTKLKILASGSLRERIIRFLFWSMDAGGVVRLDITRETWASYLAVARPSLSRELGALQSEGILQVEGRKIRVLDKMAFEAYL